MDQNERRLLEALRRIADVASEAVDGHDHSEHHYSDNGSERSTDERITCTPKSLPTGLLVKAAETAARISPANAPMLGQIARVSADMVSDPLMIAVVTTKYWGPMARKLPVSFMEKTPSDLRKRILSHMNAWTRTASIEFVETKSTGIVRISFGPGGYWSYLGTDILHIAPDRQTMNLEGFTMSMPESEFKRVIRHETGHTLGFPHEHMRRQLVARIDRQKAYDFFRRTQGWDRRTVDQQVLTPLDERSLLGTPPDETSIMAYQIPGSITRNGQPIIGGTDINETDYAFAGRIYPKPNQEPQQTTPYLQSMEHVPLDVDLEMDWGGEFVSTAATL